MFMSLPPESRMGPPSDIDPPVPAASDEPWLKSPRIFAHPPKPTAASSASPTNTGIAIAARLRGRASFAPASLVIAHIPEGSLPGSRHFGSKKERVHGAGKLIELRWDI
jgi:hypothetical protein